MAITCYNMSHMYCTDSFDLSKWETTTNFDNDYHCLSQSDSGKRNVFKKKNGGRIYIIT